ncbi:putative phage infection (PIP) family protein YhgE [Paenibacillus sp. DS2015]|uniref:YhgE/Pip domain-containing protein n=1 Tax=Paenibacillus sp. DS2015 TaxID=3373917 RepID=UPI003D1F5F2F
MKNFLTMLKNGSVIGGITMVVFYQIVMISVFMGGYSAIPKNISKLTIAIVNEDATAGKEIAQQFEKQLPFHIVSDLKLDEAKEDLDNRDIHMIVHIPADFTQLLSKQGEHPQMDFFINQSNSAMISSTMQTVSSQIAANLNQQFAIQGVQGILEGMKMPTDQAKELAADIPVKMTSNIVNTNPTPAGMHNQMAPFFLTMVNYTGAMIFSMMIVGAINFLKAKMGRAQAFWSSQAVIAVVSLIAPLVGITIYFCIQGGYGAETFIKVWLLHSLELFAAIQFMSIFSFLLKEKAIFINLTFMLIQTISSGATVDYDMMPGFFKFLSHISIMFYTVQTDFSLFFGGGKTTQHLTGLIIMALASFLIAGLSYLLTSPVSKDESITPTTAS